MRDHTYHPIHRFVAANGQTVEIFYTPATGRTVATRTFPNDTSFPWCNWVTSLVDSQENCVQHISGHGELVTLIGHLTLEGFARDIAVVPV
jgi:hypothetical protein